VTLSMPAFSLEATCERWRRVSERRWDPRPRLRMRS
jgi:hypothetical protein